MIPFVIRMMVRDEVRRRILSEALTDSVGQDVEGLTLRVSSGVLTAETSAAVDSLSVTLDGKTVNWSGLAAGKNYAVWSPPGLRAIAPGDTIDLEITAGDETNKATVTVPGGAEAAPSGGSAAGEAPVIVHRSKVRTPLGPLEGTTQYLCETTQTQTWRAQTIRNTQRANHAPSLAEGKIPACSGFHRGQSASLCMGAGAHWPLPWASLS